MVLQMVLVKTLRAPRYKPRFTDMKIGPEPAEHVGDVKGR